MKHFDEKLNSENILSIDNNDKNAFFDDDKLLKLKKKRESIF